MTSQKANRFVLFAKYLYISVHSIRFFPYKGLI